MKAKTRVKEEILPAVRLFRNNLDDLARLFAEYSSDISVSDNQYFYTNLAEMREKIGARLRQLQIAGSQPTATLSFDPSTGVKLTVIESGDDDSQEHKNAELLFLRVKGYLHEHRTSVARFMSPAVTTLVLALASVAIGLSIVTSPHSEKVVYVDAIHLAFFVIGLSVLMLTTVSAARRSTQYFLYYGHPSELSSFWKRKKDDLILVTIGAILGALITGVIQIAVSHFSKK